MNFKMILLGFVVAFAVRFIEDTFMLKPYTLILPLILTLIGYEMMRRWRLRGKK